MNVDTEEVVDVNVAEEKVESVAVSEEEAETEYKVTITIHHIVHILMELLILKLRYMIKVNINHCTKISKLELNNSKVRLVGSMDIPHLMDMF